jgi:hypothetical protein
MRLRYAKTIRPATFLFLCAALCCLISCATSVRFEVKHPPLVDLRGVRSITVIPLEWNYFGEHHEFAEDVTDALSYGIRKAGVYTFVDPVKLKGIARSRYHEYVDVFITGEITGVSTDRNVSIREEKQKDKNGDEIIVEKKYTTVTSTVSIAYEYVRAGDLQILERFKKTETSSAVIEHTERGDRYQNRNAHGNRNARSRRGPQRGMFRNSSPSRKVAQDAISAFSYAMSREILPWTSWETRDIIKGNRETDPRLQEAAKLVGKKKYREAQDIYHDLYENEGNIIAGYNMALLLEAENQYADALRVLEYLYMSLMEAGQYCPDYILNEITQLRKIIRETSLLNEYYLSR